MKFYKLELINREESYNKMFGANPNVGVLNPLAAKVDFNSLLDAHDFLCFAAFCRKHLLPGERMRRRT